jgi:hypothetical protein
MKKNPNTPSIEHDVNSWEENTLIHWLSRYGSYALLIAIGTLLVLTLAYRLTSGGSEKAEKDYFNADREFQLFVQPISADADPMVNNEALKRLEAIMQRRPELHAKYDGLIAQTLIFRGHTDKAAHFANLALMRTASENQPFYAEYAENTLLIGNQQYQEALTRSQDLQKKMTETLAQSQDDQHRAFGDTLFAFNLVRIGMLQQQLGLSKEELKTWQEWEHFVQQNQGINLAGMVSSVAFEKQLNHFADKKVSLLNYIEAREKTLQQ